RRLGCEFDQLRDQATVHLEVVLAAEEQVVQPGLGGLAQVDAPPRFRSEKITCRKRRGTTQRHHSGVVSQNTESTCPVPREIRACSLVSACQEPWTAHRLSGTAPTSRR